jgi:hypothetical protein
MGKSYHSSLRICRRNDSEGNFHTEKKRAPLDSHDLAQKFAYERRRDNLIAAERAQRWIVRPPAAA